MNSDNHQRYAPPIFVAPEEGAERSSSEGGANNLPRLLASVTDERDAIADELKKVKRKYRRVTTDAQTAKNEVATLSRQLAEAKAQLTAIEQRSLGGLVRRIARNAVAVRLKPRPSPKARRAQQVDLVRKSHLFDADWYLATYPDIAEARLDPALHYVLDGWSEGRDPGPEFSTSRYLKANRDVAQSALNPLLHYLEHGLAEGRSAGGGRSTILRRSVEQFGQGAAVFKSVVVNPDPIRWVRHYDLDPARPQVRIGDQSCGYLANGELPSLASALARFLRLSGLQGDGPSVAHVAADRSVQPDMIDGWFAGQCLLRTRWALYGGQPHVVRGYQRGRDGKLQLIGEGLVSGALDVVDFPLTHPLLPILFVACRPDGQCVGAANLFFPSLCRGGANYAELLSEGAASPIDLGERYARRLEAILAGEARALVRTVRVDLAGADGTRPMFQSDTQDWLDWVMRIDIGEAIAPARGEREDLRFLADRASGATGHHRDRPSSTGQIILPSDTTPTIAILIAVAAEGVDHGAARTITTSMIIAHTDPAKPALSITVPGDLTMPTALSASAFPLAFARIEGAEPRDRDIPGAIRNSVERPLADSELLLPLSRDLPIFAAPVAPREAVVAIEPDLWSLPSLEAGLAALDLQIGSDTVTICMVGTVDPERRALVERAFAGRTESRVNVHAFVEGLGDADVLHLGPGVVLHDARTLLTLQSLLVGCSSVSCPILRCARHGKNWGVGVADAGQFLESGPVRAGTALAQHAQMLWRSTIPVISQPASLWLARTAILRNAPEEASAPHFLCTWLSASYFDADKSEPEPTLSLPAARCDLSLRVAELRG